MRSAFSILKSTFFAACICVTFAFSCEDDPIADPGEDVVVSQSLPGAWLLFEQGFSPGAGYQTVPVPPDPPQTITFEEDFTLSSNMPGWSDYGFYRVLEDTVMKTKVLAFFRTDPGAAVPDLAALEHSYVMSWKAGTMRLSYRWCIEGCHLAFKKIGD